MTAATLAPAAALSPSEIATFNDDGFLVFDDIFTPAEIATLTSIVEGNEKNHTYQKVERTVHQVGLIEQHPAWVDLARDARIIDRIRPLIGNDIQVQHSKLAAKPLTKNAGPFGWHQDYAYFPHTNTDLVAVMVMLDDATPENGCMSMVRGSHKQGLLNHADANGFFAGSCQDAVWEREPQRVIPVTPRAGGISIHHCLTLHGSPANLSGRPRRGIVIQYRAADAYQMADEIFADTGLIVSGRRSDSARCTAGTVKLPRFRGRPGLGYGKAWNQVGELAAAENAKSEAAK